MYGPNSTGVYSVVATPVGGCRSLPATRFALMFFSKKTPGEVSPSTVEDTIVQDNALELALENCFPNPVKSKSSISYNLPAEGNVQLNVYNIMGECVATLVNETLNAGYHEAFFNANGLSSGIYTYRLSFTSGSQTKYINKKLVVTK
jgi:hypothetical protein